MYSNTGNLNKDANLRTEFDRALGTGDKEFITCCLLDDCTYRLNVLQVI